jgi:hypothetical protein
MLILPETQPASFGYGTMHAHVATAVQLAGIGAQE